MKITSKPFLDRSKAKIVEQIYEVNEKKKLNANFVR